MRCLSPITLYEERYIMGGYLFREKNRLVPCGKCEVCVEDRKNEWIVRMNCEYHSRKRALFITLTYSEDNIPKDYSVDKRELQLFFKRLRKRTKNEKISYYACGEYGDEFGRAHYHVLMYYNLDTEDLKKYVEESWNGGHADFEVFDYGRTKYIVDYLDKKNKHTHYRGKKLKPAFQLMSKGLGLDYLLRYEDQIAAKCYVVLKGFRYKIPRYFVKKSKKIEEALLAKEALEDARTIERLCKNKPVLNFKNAKEIFLEGRKEEMIENAKKKQEQMNIRSKQKIKKRRF